MELEYPNRIYPISDIKRRFWTPRLLEVPPPPLEYMCVPIFSGKGVRLRRLSREDFPRKPGKCVCFVKSNGYQLSRSRGYIFNKIRGFRWWGMSKGPPNSTEVGGPDEKWQKLRKQLWIFWQARLSIDRVFIDCCVLVRFCNFWFSTLSLFNECVQSRVNFKLITCNYSYRRGISLSCGILHLPSMELVYDIIRVE